MNRRIASYYRELRYILTNSLNLRTRGALITRCILFHLNNWLRFANAKAPFKAALRIEPNYEVEIVLRTFSGDLFVLFEVLDEEAYHIPENYLASGSVRVILDCGANIGLTSLYLAARYPAATIYSIEPDEQNFSLLSFNTRQERRIIPINAALVGKPRRTVRLTTNQHAWENQIADDGEVEISAITIEEICERYQIREIDLLKMDIEGGEVDVFRNGLRLDRVRFAIAELHGEYGYEHFAEDMARNGLRAGRGGDLKGLSMNFARRV